MLKWLTNNIAHTIVFIRIILVFIVLVLFSMPSFTHNIIGVILLGVAAILDGVDGYLARKNNTSSLVGGMLDTLGDRITENLLLIFFAFVRLIPIYVPLIFIARSLISDFIRFLWVRQGISTFSMHQSKLGKALVASKFSRIAYLILKIAIFFLGGIVISLQSLSGTEITLSYLKIILYSGANILLATNLIRFCLLVYDSRIILRQELSKQEG
ncbi:MAG: CDP-alcohol phosphatidyltransferase family protein [PVC group bacterium]|nr:CDP-alcohol phosphatidyltransferase family protein [PVC group bacterium]